MTARAGEHEAPWPQDDETDRRPAAWRAYFETTAMLMQELEAKLKAESGLDLGDFNMMLVLFEADGHRMRMG